MSAKQGEIIAHNILYVIILMAVTTVIVLLGFKLELMQLPFLPVKISTRK